ncbi:MAG: hypothetical protein H0U75_11550 [Legionella sp.]|nr:hypothetical protein [Legionella sp.]
MKNDTLDLNQLITEMAALIEKNDDPDPQLYLMLLQQPELAFQIIDMLNQFDDDLLEESPNYSACIFALDICVAQLQAAADNNKIIFKIMLQLMDHLATAIRKNNHVLGFWLPILNAFYEAQVQLSDNLKNAYLDLAMQESATIESTEASHLDSIRQLIHELSDLSIYEIAENFFAQSYAMPAEFFADLIADLYQIEEGHDIAILTLLHPLAEVRDVVVATLDQILDTITVSSVSLSRLETIKHWYAPAYHDYFNRWIKNQRKKGVVFQADSDPCKCIIRATEVDGSGSQGLFIQVSRRRKNRLCSLLLKYGLGLKDAWATDVIPVSEVREYYREAFQESVTLRTVDLSYFKIIIEHFLAVTIEQAGMPSIHFLEIYELLGQRLRPNKLDSDYLFEQMSIQIVPFTQETIDQSLQRSKSWLKNKKFTESWFLESPAIDKIVNQNSSFIDGVKVCKLAQAMDAIFSEELELNRDKWQFHFLWLALWVKAHEKKNEKIWQDSFLIAYTIRQGLALEDIPVMKEICHQTLLNSIETMQDRKTYLSQE